MMNGLPLSGKTTIARFLSKEMELTYIATNIIRERLNLLDKLFDETCKDEIYNEINKEFSANKNINGQIIDATFNKKFRRLLFYGAVLSKDLIIIKVVTSKKEIKRRQEERLRMPDTVDFQGKNTFDYIKNTFDEIEIEEISNLPSVSLILVETYEKSKMKCDIAYSNSHFKNSKVVLEFLKKINI